MESTCSFTPKNYEKINMAKSKHKNLVAGINSGYKIVLPEINKSVKDISKNEDIKKDSNVFQNKNLIRTHKSLAIKTNDSASFCLKTEISSSSVIHTAKNTNRILNKNVDNFSSYLYKKEPKKEKLQISGNIKTFYNENLKTNNSKLESLGYESQYSVKRNTSLNSKSKNRFQNNSYSSNKSNDKSVYTKTNAKSYDSKIKYINNSEINKIDESNKINFNLQSLNLLGFKNEQIKKDSTWKKSTNVVQELKPKVLKAIDQKDSQLISYFIRTKNVKFPIKVRIFTEMKNIDIEIAYSKIEIPTHTNYTAIKAGKKIVISESWENEFDRSENSKIYVTVFAWTPVIGHIATAFKGYNSSVRHENSQQYTLPLLNHDESKKLMIILDNEIEENKDYLDCFANGEDYNEKRAVSEFFKQSIAKSQFLDKGSPILGNTPQKRKSFQKKIQNDNIQENNLLDNNLCMSSTFDYKSNRQILVPADNVESNQISKDPPISSFRNITKKKPIVSYKIINHDLGNDEDCILENKRHGQIHGLKDVEQINKNNRSRREILDAALSNKVINTKLKPDRSLIKLKMDQNYYNSSNTKGQKEQSNDTKKVNSETNPNQFLQKYLQNQFSPDQKNSNKNSKENLFKTFFNENKNSAGLTDSFLNTTCTQLFYSEHNKNHLETITRILKEKSNPIEKNKTLAANFGVVSDFLISKKVLKKGLLEDFAKMKHKANRQERYDHQSNMQHEREAVREKKDMQIKEVLDYGVYKVFKRKWCTILCQYHIQKKSEFLFEKKQAEEGRRVLFMIRVGRIQNYFRKRMFWRLEFNRHTATKQCVKHGLALYAQLYKQKTRRSNCFKIAL